jgi:hypothetical protein
VQKIILLTYYPGTIANIRTMKGKIVPTKYITTITIAKILVTCGMLTNGLLNCI